ncbi:DUF1398 family protein [Leptospira idonii]|uniref:DUF1398 domain-containing protein n=1 Tax=Leptospira idonii TaxID=1193500 RepID=A0A4V3JYG6_9LEPT|nr:DUF1398 family protein [Leptospira idonii]TGN19996.1 DUF1398 domain-containing protein [Leptospira idonii]
MNLKTIKETVEKTLSAQITFPQVVGILLQEGIESYHVDYVRSENRYYTSEGETHLEPVPHDFSAAALEFSAEDVRKTIKRVQAGEINYIEFSKEVLKAGCVYYIAYLKGKKVIYFGREGEFHIEEFPKK